MKVQPNLFRIVQYMQMLTWSDNCTITSTSPPTLQQHIWNICKYLRKHDTAKAYLQSVIPECSQGLAAVLSAQTSAQCHKSSMKPVYKQYWHHRMQLMFTFLKSFILLYNKIIMHIPQALNSKGPHLIGCSPAHTTSMSNSRSHTHAMSPVEFSCKLLHQLLLL